MWFGISYPYRGFSVKYMFFFGSRSLPVLVKSRSSQVVTCPFSFADEPSYLCFSRKLASASWSLLALASIPGAAQGHHVIFHAKGGDPPPVFVST